MQLLLIVMPCVRICLGGWWKYLEEEENRQKSNNDWEYNVEEESHRCRPSIRFSVCVCCVWIGLEGRQSS